MDPIDYDNEEIIEDEFSDEEIVDKIQPSKTKKKGAITIRSVEDDDDASDIQSDDESVNQNENTMNESDDEFEDDEEIDDEEMENKNICKTKTKRIWKKIWN